MYQIKDGYWRMSITVNGRRKQPLVHRYVWELYNGPIPEGFDVHHKNENPACNCICNLELMEHGEHQRLHNLKMSDERKAKIGTAHRGKRLSTESKALIAEANRGNKYRLGKSHTEESKKKMSESRKKYFDRLKASSTVERQDNLVQEVV